MGRRVGRVVGERLDRGERIVLVEGGIGTYDRRCGVDGSVPQVG